MLKRDDIIKIYFIREVKNLNKHIKITFIILLFFIIIFAFYNISPIGNNTLAVYDAYNQYALFNKFLLSNPLTDYSLSAGFGFQIIPFFAYYCSSPFNLLFVLPINPYISFNIIIILKAIFIANSFLYVLRKTYKEDNKMIIYSLMYLFCGFFVNYYWNIMWLDAMILFPLIYYFLKNYITSYSTKNLIKYIILLTILIFSNFYIAYEVYIFIMLIFFTSKFNNVKEFIKKGMNILFFSIIAITNNIFLLFYTLKSLLNNNNDHYAIKYEFNIFNLFKSILIGYKEQTTVIEGYAYLYISMLGLLIFVLYLLKGNKLIKKKLIGLVLFCILICCISPLNYIMHGFDIPNGLYNRYTFMISFLILINTYDFKESDFNKKDIIISLTILLSSLSIGAIILYFTNNLDIRNLRMFILSAGLLILYSYLLYEKKHKLIIIVFLIEIFISFVLNLSVKEITSIDNKENSDYYRTEVFYLEKWNIIENNFCKMDINGIHCFMSTINSDTSLFLHPLIKDCGNTYIGYNIYNYFLNSIFSVKNIKTDYNFMDENYFIKENNDIYTYKYPLSLGFEVNKDLSSIELPKGMMESNNYLFTEMTGINKNLYNSVNYEKNGKVIKFKEDYDSIFILAVRNEGIIQDYIGSYIFQNKEYENIDINMCLNNVKKNDELIINDYEGDVVIYTMNDNIFLEGYNELKDNQLNITDYSDTYIKGTAEEGYMFLSLAYNKNWECYIDGKKTKIIPIKDAFCEIQIPKGTHEIELVYNANYSKMIIIINILSIFVTLYLIIKKKHWN